MTCTWTNFPLSFYDTHRYLSVASCNYNLLTLEDGPGSLFDIGKNKFQPNKYFFMNILTFSEVFLNKDNSDDLNLKYT